jgi:hypothetical protein
MGPFSKKSADIEALPVSEKHIDGIDYIPDEGAISAETFVVGDGWYAKTQRLAGKFGVEQRGIERVPSDERDSAPISQVGTMWLSANMVVSVGNLSIFRGSRLKCAVLCSRCTCVSDFLPWVY